MRYVLRFTKPDGSLSDLTVFDTAIETKREVEILRRARMRSIFVDAINETGSRQLLTDEDLERLARVE